MRMTYYVTPVWDAEHRIHRSESNIAGLHIEAPTLEEFQEVVLDIAPELMVANHPGAAAQTTETLLPTTTWTYGEPLQQRSG